MKTFLNFFRELDEINFGDSRFAFEYNAIGFDAADRDVFVFFASNSLEVVSQGDCRETQKKKADNLHLQIYLRIS